MKPHPTSWLTFLALLALAVPARVRAEDPAEPAPFGGPIQVVELRAVAEPAPEPAPETQAGGHLPGSLRPALGARGILGFGGEADVEVLGRRFHADMETSMGFGLEGSYPILPYFAVGGEVRSVWWLDEPDDDAGVSSHWLLELAPFVKVGYPFGGESSWGRVYARVPVGLTLSSLNDDFESYNGVETSMGTGWSVGVYGGFEWFFGRLGLGGELGYLYRSFSNEIEGGGRQADLETSFAQFGIQAHVAVVL